MAEVKNNNFTEGPIMGPLLKFAVPILLAMLLQSAYGAVDLLIVGRFGTSADISGVATGSQFMHLVLSIGGGFATAVTVLLGQGLVGAFMVRIPVAFLMSREAAPSLFRVGLATPASTATQIVLCFAYLAIMKRRHAFDMAPADSLE